MLAVALAGVLAMSPAAPALGAGTLLQCQPRLGMRAFETGAPACPQAAKHCVGVIAHVVVEGDAPVQTPVWFAGQIAAANRLFATIDVGFEVTEVRTEAAERAAIDSRADRDRLGRGAHDPAVVHVWVVRRLADVDIAGDEIRGVHWRDRADLTRRFIILSSIAGDRTLAHELGHFFGLPHSKYPESIMNKTPRDEPPWELRGFHRREYAIMRGRRDAMFGDGTLRDRARGRDRRHAGQAQPHSGGS